VAEAKSTAGKMEYCDNNAASTKDVIKAGRWHLQRCSVHCNNLTGECIFMYGWTASLISDRDPIFWVAASLAAVAVNLAALQLTENSASAI
jgi:hypothetical protein